MYSFLVIYGTDDWKGPPVVFPSSRVFEYTSDALRDEFKSRDDESAKQLSKYPALFAYEQGNNADARIGRVIALRSRQSEIRVEYEIDEAFPPIPHKKLSELVWELDIGQWELSRTHWAIKDVDLLGELLKADIITKDQVARSFFNKQNFHAAEADPPAVEIQPNVFRVPKEGIENDLVSVMRPFQPAFSEVYKSLQEACHNIGIRCLDANEVWNEDEIIQDIFSLIYRSRVVICDFTDRNPNVFYEAGIAHTLGRTVIPIVQNKNDIPFDLSHHRYVEYLNNHEGRKDLQTLITPRLLKLFDIQ